MPNLETPAEIEQQAKINNRNFIKNKLEQNNNDLTLSEKAELKKLQDVFDKVQKGEPLENIETFYMPNNDIFNKDDISETHSDLIMDLINRSTLFC